MAKTLVSRGGWFMPKSTGLLRLGFVAWIAACLLPPILGDEPARRKDPPTFTRDVAPILQQKCQNCHRSHHIGPFALETIEPARKRASDISLVVTERQMPPWKPAPGVGPRLKHDQSLSPQQIAILEAWSEAGAPRGDPKDMPPLLRFSTDWKLGPPDLVLEPAEEFSMPAAGPDTYRCFVLPTNLASASYISAIDFRPANVRVVHHINAFLDTTGAARARDAAEPGLGYTSFSGPGVAMSVTLPNGRTQGLIQIPDWDPSWQSTYFFQKRILLPTGSVVKVVAHFDNSEHPRNRNHPPKPVSYGFGANDEMCEGFIAVVKQNQDLTRPGAIDDLPLLFAKQRFRTLRKQLAKQAR